MTAHSAIIDSGYCGGEGDGTNLTWEFSDDGTLTISGEGEMVNYEWVNYPWSYEYEDYISRVVISEGVTSIGDFAFRGCSSLASIEIPESVTSIGEGAFCDCNSLSSINVLENNPAYCSIDGVVFSKDQKELVIHPAGKGNVYKIPESVTIISNYAFYGCSLLTSIEIPESVTDIGKNAFYYCSSLTSIEIPSSVMSIGEWAFNGCSSLANIEIPDGVTSIGYYAFGGCSSLESIVIPESVTSIGNYAFVECASLESIKIPKGVTSIGNYAFAECASLESIVIPEGVTSIEEGTFWGCSSLTSIEIPSSVMSIGEWAFNVCSSLASIEIPESVTSIGEEAFCYCSSLEYIISNNPTPPSCIGLSCFSYVDPNIPIYVPAESIDLYRNAEGWDYFTNFLPLEELGGDEPGGSAVEETEAVGIALKITARDGRIYCEEEFRIVNLAGQDVTAMNGELQGTYIVVSGGKAVKVSVE